MPPKTLVPVTVLGVIAAVLLFGLPASANADSPALDQYTESIPSGGGNHTTDKGDNGGNGGNGGGGDASTSGPTLDSAQLDALRSQGRNGERAAAALEATSGSSDSNGSKSSNGSNSSNGSLSDAKTLDAADAEGKAPVEAVLSSMFGGGGVALPLIMLGVLVGGLVIAARKRAGSGSIDE